MQKQILFYSDQLWQGVTAETYSEKTSYIVTVARYTNLYSPAEAGSDCRDLQREDWQVTVARGPTLLHPDGAIGRQAAAGCDFQSLPMVKNLNFK